MTNQEIYNFLSRLIDEDVHGGNFSPKTYNYFASYAITNTFKRLVSELYGQPQEGGRISETHFDSKLLKDLIEEETVTPATGIVLFSALGETYAYWGSMLTSAAYNGQIRKVSLVTHNEYETRQSNILSKPITRHPIAKLNSTGVTIYPTDIPSVDFTYIRKPVTPQIDYYIDANKQVQFFDAATTSYVLLTNEQYSDGTTSGTVTPNTTELDIDDDFHIEFVTEMARLLGIKDQDQLRTEYARIEQQRQDTD